MARSKKHSFKVKGVTEHKAHGKKYVRKASRKRHGGK